MSIKQLFSDRPPHELVIRVMKFVGFKSLSDDIELSVLDLELNNAKANIIGIIGELEDYYIPCKAKVYLQNLTEKKCMTVCRQLLKTIGYTFISREKYIVDRKYTMYKLITLEKKKRRDMLRKTGKVCITFD
jgi:hypothetical protein